VQLRTLCYYLAQVKPSYVVQLPKWLIVTLSEALLVRLGPKMMVDGIRIADPVPDTRTQFLDTVREALELLEANDALRYARLKREVHTILNVPLRGTKLAQYTRISKTCVVDLRYFLRMKEREAGVALLACALVHESTHGRLFGAKVIQGTKDARVERLCFKEEARFARKLGIDLGPDWGFIRESVSARPCRDPLRASSSK
jgi:hypothetical protein